MKRTDAFPSKYLSKTDVNPPIIATIKTVEIEDVGGEGNKETKPVIFFRGDVKPMILNNTNWLIIEESHGADTDDWIGKQIEMYFDPSVMYGGKKVGGVRVRIPAAGAVQAPAPAPVADNRPMGPDVASKLMERLATVMGKDAEANLDVLRRSLSLAVPAAAPIIGGDVASWPRSLGTHIKEWFEVAQDDNIPF